MRDFSFLLRACVVFVFAGLLSGCGGGGGEPAANVEVPVAITLQPVSQTASAGASVTFSAGANGANLAFQWQRSTDAAATWADLAGATGSSYTLASATMAMNGYRYRVVVRSASSSVESVSVTLTVAPPAPPVVTQDPGDQAVVAGANATFSVAASGSELVFQWQSSVNAGASWADLAGATNASLTLTAVPQADSGRRFRAVVSNGGGTATSVAAVLSVTPAPEPPTVTSQPADASVQTGQTATFTVVASGVPTPSHQWQSSAPAGTSFTDIAGATAPSYSTPPLTTAATGTRYRVRVSNASGTVTSVVATLTVAAPPSITLRSVALAVSSTSCAGRSNGTLACWGNNDGGDVNGDRFSASYFSSPTQVSGMSSVVSVATGSHSCAAREDGTLACWGTNFSGQLGLGASQISTFFSTPPTTVPGMSGVVQVVAGWGYSCARRSDGSVACWGRNETGQLGNGSTTDRPSPGAVPGLSGVKSLAAGYSHVCALKADGSVACWGSNGSGALGDGSTTARLNPTTVPGLSNVTAIATGFGHTCALKSDATLACWGSNGSGQTGSTTATLTPRAVPGLGDVVALSASNSHTCVLRAAGTVACWGFNANGELGGGASFPMNSITPVAVLDLTGVVALAGGSQSTCAALADGRLYCWGLNANGQLGDGSLTSRSRPQLVPGLTLQLR